MHKIVLLAILIVLGSLIVRAQSSSDWQMWSNLVVGTDVGNRLYVHADARHRTIIGENNDKWRSSGFLVRGDYSVGKFVNTSLDFVYMVTKQTEIANSTEHSQRIGVKVFFFRNGYNLFKPHKGEEGVSTRWEFNNFTRFEHRMFNYSKDADYDHFWRMRNRTQAKYALNRERLNENNLVKIAADFEFFVPLSKEPEERYLSKIRFRIGPEYRYSYRWRFRLMYAFDYSGDGVSRDENIENQMIVFRIKHNI